MTTDYDKNDTSSIAQIHQRELDMVREGEERFHKRLAKKTLDQTRAGIEILSLNVDGIEEGLKWHLRQQELRKGGSEAFWQHWLQRCDVNWKTSMRLGVEHGDKAGNPYFNPIEEQNLFPIASIAGRVAMEGYTKNQTLTKLVLRLGEAFHAQVWENCINETSAGRDFMRSLSRQTAQMSNDPLTRRQRAMAYATKQGYEPEKWKENQIVQCGIILWNSIIHGGGIFCNYKVNEGDDKWKTYRPRLLPEVEKIIAERNAELASMEPRFEPMLEKPVPWTKDSFGPFRSMQLNHMTKMVKNMWGAQVEAIERAVENDELKHPMLALTKLQSVPYTVNQYILRAVDWVRSDEDRARQVSGFPNLKRVKLEKLDYKAVAKLPKRERTAIYAERREAEADNRDADSNKTKVDGWIQEALKQGTNRFYLPHVFDRRGRVYHLPDFGHHNTDALRAMFYLANKKPVGDQFHWICIALANNYGLDKRPFQDRQDWSEANKEIINAAGRTFAMKKANTMSLSLTKMGTQELANDPV